MVLVSFIYTYYLLVSWLPLFESPPWHWLYAGKPSEVAQRAHVGWVHHHTYTPTRQRLLLVRVSYSSEADWTSWERSEGAWLLIVPPTTMPPLFPGVLLLLLLLFPVIVPDCPGAPLSRDALFSMPGGKECGIRSGDGCADPTSADLPTLESA